MNRSQFIDKYSLNLTEQQLQALDKVNSPMLILACPGSGKTTTMVARIAYMVECCNINPANILALTFTRNAAKEMRERFRKQYCACPGVNDVEFRTISSIGLEIVRNHSEQNVKKSLSILENNYPVLKQIGTNILKQNDDAPNYLLESEVKELKQKISYVKNMLMNSNEIEGVGINIDGLRLLDVYNKYTKFLSEEGKMDYDDMLAFAYNILKDCPQIRADYQQHFSYILLDEAQDTSYLQFKIIKLFVAENHHVFMVGDEDQSIYGFRAAYPEMLMSFKDEYRDGLVQYLEENFRSREKIIEVSSKVIKNNQYRYDKNMIAVRKDSAIVKCTDIPRKEQYMYIIEKYLENKNNQTAILFRNNESALPFIYHLDKCNLEYDCQSISTDFFNSWTFTGLKALTQFAKKQDDEDLFLKTCTAFYVKKNIAKDVCQMARGGGLDNPEYNNSLLNYLIATVPLKPRVANGIKVLPALFDVLEEKGMQAFLYSLMGSNYKNSKTNALFAMSCIAEPDETPKEYFEKMELLRELIESKRENGDLILSTIHKSKGLEYDHVYMADAIDGIFPSEIDATDMEEERRLFYVGLTRAKDRLEVLRYPGENTLFADEVKAALNPKEVKKPIAPVVEVKKHQSLREVEYCLSGDNQLEDMQIGAKVKHKAIGIGTIISRNDSIIEIDFGQKIGKKKFNIKILAKVDALSKLI